MKTAAAFTFLLCAALAGCATTSRPHHALIDNATPLARDIFDAVSPAQFESASFTSSRGTVVPYRLLRPSRLSPGKIYPLVVQLHGSGGVGTDNLAQLERMAKSWAIPDVRDRYQAFILIPQFSIRSANYGPASPDQYATASLALNDAVELVNNFSSTNPVDKSRIYASGFSMGGSAAWLLPSIAPEMFAGIVPISGVAPPDSLVEDFVHLPVFVIHGSADSENPIYADRRFTAAIANHGGRNAWLREYRGLVHQPPSDIHPGFWWRDWLFGQQRK